MLSQISTMLFTIMLVWPMMILLSHECLGATTSSQKLGSELSAKFRRIGCNGTFEESLFNQTDNICEKCESFFPLGGLIERCRQNCFTTKFFNDCVLFQMTEEDLPQIQRNVERLGVTDLGSLERTSEKTFPQVQNTTKQNHTSKDGFFSKVEKFFREYMEDFAQYGRHL